MSLYIKHRPKELGEFLGNKGTVRALNDLLQRDVEDIPHAFLFEGPSGCGKTTLARIVANELECGAMDMTEINTANNRGIDTARELIDIASRLPMSGQTRVILLDEVHMATKEFQNALLKPLEDTPDHTYFILCTTNSEAIIPTVKNRCTRFAVDALNAKEVKSLLQKVIWAEEAEVEDSCFNAIVKAADGCPRQALVILDKVLDSEGGDYEQIIQETEGDAEAEAIDLCRAIMKEERWGTVAGILKGLKGDPERIRRAMLGYFSSVILGSDGGKADYAVLVLENFKDYFYSSGKAGLIHACYITVNKI